MLQFDNGATLDFIEDTGEIKAQHYAFLVGEDDFDAIWDRISEQGRQFWADPHKRRPEEINHEDGGRGLYWEGPDGHWLEIITRPYGSADRKEMRSHDRAAAPPLPARPLPRHHRRGLRLDPARRRRAGYHLPLRRHVRVPRHR